MDLGSKTLTPSSDLLFSSSDRTSFSFYLDKDFFVGGKSQDTDVATGKSGIVD